MRKTIFTVNEGSVNEATQGLHVVSYSNSNVRYAEMVCNTKTYNQIKKIAGYKELDHAVLDKGDKGQRFLNSIEDVAKKFDLDAFAGSDIGGVYKTGSSIYGYFFNKDYKGKLPSNYATNKLEESAVFEADITGNVIKHTKGILKEIEVTKKGIMALSNKDNAEKLSQNDLYQIADIHRHIAEDNEYLQDILKTIGIKESAVFEAGKMTKKQIIPLVDEAMNTCLGKIMKKLKIESGDNPEQVEWDNLVEEMASMMERIIGYNS